MNIRDFKKGDEIVRTEASKPINPDGAPIDFFGLPIGGSDRGDRSYMGEKLIFVGIANARIYAENNDSFHQKVLGKTRMDLALDLWDEGWEYWVDPDTLSADIDYSDEKFKSKRSRESIERQIKQAIKKEDYETAERLKEELKDL